MRRRLAFLVLIFVIAVWNAALIAAPAGEPRVLSAMTYAAGSLICHQQPARSFHRDGAQYPVCARCHGLYAGALLGVFGWVLLSGGRTESRVRTDTPERHANIRRALVVVAVPTLLTVALAWAGIWDAGNVVRALLAVPLGAVIAAVVTAVAAGDLR